MKKTPLKKKSKNPIPALKHKTDALFSKAIRYRDGQLRDGAWYTECITCGRWELMSKMHCGHFMPRRFLATRWSDENCNGQCPSCNTFGYGEQYKYGLALDKKYGDGTAKRLHAESQVYFKVTRDYLEQVIADAKSSIDFYESKSIN